MEELKVSKENELDNGQASFNFVKSGDVYQIEFGFSEAGKFGRKVGVFPISFPGGFTLSEILQIEFGVPSNNIDIFLNGQFYPK